MSPIAYLEIIVMLQELQYEYRICSFKSRVSFNSRVSINSRVTSYEMK